jgi:O-antigen/teichoic acid export membrane protein
MQRRDQVSASAWGIASFGELSLKWAARVIGQVSWAVIDQALFGLSNFTANLLLARWLAPAEYGAYVAASSVFWMITTGPGGFLYEPMIVFGPNRFRDRRSSYFAVLLVLACGLSALIAGALLVTGFVMIFWGSQSSGVSLLGYALAAPVLMLLWLFRRACYVDSIPRLAACANAIYLLAMLALMYALYRGSALSAFTAPIAAGGAGVAAILGFVALRGRRVWSRWNSALFRDVVGTHWRYGRWATVAHVVAWVPGSFYFMILPWFAGLSANGALNALTMLMMPAAQAYTAFGLLLVPAFGHSRQDGSANALVWKILMLLVVGAALYALLITLFGRPVMDLLYRGRYAEYTQFAWLIGLLVIPTAAIAVLSSALRARERPDHVLWAYLIAAAVICTLGVAAIAVWGLLGAILGQLFGYTGATLAMLWWVWRSNPRVRLQATTTLSV